MKKIFLLIIFIFINLNAIDTLTPNKVFKTTGDVQDLKYKNNVLYTATSNGTIEIFDTKTDKKLNTIKLPDIKDFMGDVIPSKIYSIDILENKLLIVSQGMKGYRNIYIYENNKLKKLIDIEKKFYIQKAYFVNKNKIIFALLSNQIGLFDIKTQKQDYLIQISASSFSDFMISENKKNLATTDESGIVRILDIKEGKLTKNFKGINLDKVYQLDFKNNVILTAGQDRKAVIYNYMSHYSMDFNFLLYSCALSPKAKLGAIAFNEQSDVLIFDIKTKNRLYKLKGQKAVVTKILFINKNEIFVSSDSQEVNYYKLKKE